MTQGHLLVFGEIRPDAPTAGASVSAHHVAERLRELPECDELIVHIHSVGGEVYEGWAIHDLLVASGKKITTLIEGQCCSMATIIALAGQKRLIRPNGTLLLHNPWGGASGDADAVHAYASELETQERRMTEYYAHRTGLSVERIEALMSDEVRLGSDQALALGFVTEVLSPTYALAYLQPDSAPSPLYISQANPDPQPMPTARLSTRIQGALRRLRSLTPRALSLTLQDGRELEVLTDAASPSVGDPVLIDGQPLADGSYTLSDGTTIEVKQGKLVVVEASESAPAEQAEVARALDAFATQLEKFASEFSARARAIDHLQARLQDQQSRADRLESALELMAQDRKTQFNGPKAQQRFSHRQGERSTKDLALAARRARNQG